MQAIQVTISKKIIHNFIKLLLITFIFSDADMYLRYAHGLISEYLTDDISAKLLAVLGLPEETPEEKPSAKRKSTQDNVETKKAKNETEVMDLSQPPREKPTPIKPLSAKDKSRIKAASNTKPITSFFKKK